MSSTGQKRHLTHINSGPNIVFLIDWLFRLTLGRALSTLAYSCGSGGYCKHFNGSRAKPWWGIGGEAPRKIFLLMSTEQKQIST